ncbi:MAG: hypothetical protein IJ138_06645 [Clostridia bacterium]|nr:hypothetical protein [Clostridia bacterium]
MERSVKIGRRFYWIVLLAVVVVAGGVVGLVLLLQNMTGHVRRMSIKSLYSEIETSAVVIRTEQSITETASDAKIVCPSGAYVQEGDEIAVLYPYGYEAALSTICAREAELYTRMEDQLNTLGAGSIPADVRALNEEIAYLGQRMRAASHGESDAAYSELETELLSLLQRRRNAMLQQLPAASTLEGEIAALDAQYNAFETTMATRLTSGYNGYISFYTDQNEEPLKDVRQLTASQVRRVLSSTSQEVPDENFSYRIVTDRSTFYVAFVASTTTAADRSKRVMQGQTYPFTIKGIDGAFMGTVISEKDSANGILYVMQVNADVRPLLDARVVEIQIQNTATGLYVPVEYIEYSNGVPYVTIKSDYGYTPIAVYIAGSDGEDAIIAARDEKLTLFAGLRYRMPIEEDDD